MSGQTAYPWALDDFPTIDPGDQENTPGKEHDVIHNNAHASLLALQAKVGVNFSSDPDSIDSRIRAIETSPASVEILVADGESAPPVMLTDESQSDFIYTG